MIFSYRAYRVKKAPGVPEGIVWRPRIPVIVIGSTGELRLEALVDTGSDQTILPRADTVEIGVVVDARRKSRVRGRLKDHEEILTLGREVKLGLQLDGETYVWPATVWFSDSNDSPPILGHSGFLEYFRATFAGDTHELDLRLTEGFPGVVSRLWS